MTREEQDEKEFEEWIQIELNNQTLNLMPKAIWLASRRLMREKKMKMDEKERWLLKCPWCKKEIVLSQRIDVGTLRKYIQKHKRLKEKGRKDG